MELPSTALSTIYTISARYYIDPAFTKAAVLQEGGVNAFIKAVNCTPKFKDVKDFSVTVEIFCQSFLHRTMNKIFSNHDTAADFITNFANFWAPLGANNDPTNLNKNWAPNVLKIWGK